MDSSLLLHSHPLQLSGKDAERPTSTCGKANAQDDPRGPNEEEEPSPTRSLLSDDSDTVIVESPFEYIPPFFGLVRALVLNLVISWVLHIISEFSVNFDRQKSASSILTASVLSIDRIIIVDPKVLYRSRSFEELCHKSYPAAFRI
mmetsp:Transcript_17770/g.36590  ORF Transcript_17770/g.36590 Transcript_17770/m.36590 type:complete len:146 (+) Transcript_17770:682-1119(+)